ncbi:O-antigen ligase family protein [uncultured Bacteroides sp.]|uniref:O-antigen ligase family protein n=1 Tax=uncultured Bacteroides sp. TaxID=162156 RepID=UPI002676B2EB|nr:O-antigen ligase family protein [uncultured Bacteroides sp.]
MYYIAQVMTKYRVKGVVKVLLLFFFVLCVYGVGLLILKDAVGQDPKSFLMMLFSSLGPIFPFYVFARQGKLSEKKLKISFSIFLIVAIMEYFAYEQKALLLLALNSSYGEVTNNSTYYFVALFPFVFLFNKRPVLQYIFIACIFGFVLSGMKRGAILVSTLLLIWFVFRTMKNATWKKKFLITCILVVFVLVGVVFVENLYNTSDYFQRRVEDTFEGQSSGRSRLYATYWNHYINNDNLFQLLFGEGAYHTENILHYKAHNDWLELLIDCGLFGTILYSLYWCKYIKMWLRNRSKPIMYSIIGACFIFTFIRTFFSMSFSDMPFSMCMIMGYCFGTINKTYQLEHKI